MNKLEFNPIETIQLHDALVLSIGEKLEMLITSNGELTRKLKMKYLDDIEQLILLANKVGAEYGFITTSQEHDFEMIKREVLKQIRSECE